MSGSMAGPGGWPGAAAAVLLCLPLLAASLVAAQPQEAALLLAFKASLENGNEVLETWQGGMDPCSFEHVACNVDGWVQRMALSNLGLRGTIPQPAGWELPSGLQELELQLNDIRGPIPPGWKLPEGLAVLYLFENPNLGGTISADWVLPSSLQELVMAGCSLAGSLPAQWRLPPSLRSLNLNSNSLTSTIPPAVTGLPSIDALYLASNRLTGTLPATMTLSDSGPMGGILRVDGNNLTGPISSWPNLPRATLVVKPGNIGLCGPAPSAPVLSEVTGADGAGLWPLFADLPACPGQQDATAQSGASSGAVVGAAVGATTAAALLAAAAALVWRRRRRRWQRAGPTTDAELAAASKSKYMESANGGNMPDPSTPWMSLGSDPQSTERASALGDGGMLTNPSLDLRASHTSLPQAMPRLLAIGSSSGRSAAAATPANLARLQERLDGLQRQPPPWLILPSRLVLDQGPDRRLVMLGRGSFGRVYLGLLAPVPEPQQAGSQGHDTTGTSTRSTGGVAGGDDAAGGSGAARGGAAACDDSTVGNGAAAGGSSLAGCGSPASRAGAPGAAALPVAIKVMDVADVDMFLREAGTMVQLNGSPHVVLLHGACVVEQHLVLVTELLEGGDLRVALDCDSAGVLSWHCQGKQVAMDIAAGLAYLHANNTTHRDLKSNNVLLTAELRAKLADVGTAALQSATFMPGERPTGSSNFRGTLAWAAPELLLAEPCTQKIDIYSLGVVLWEIATKEVPRRGCVAAPTASADCPQGLADLIGECLQQSPSNRPTAQQVLDRLQQL